MPVVINLSCCFGTLRRGMMVCACAPARYLSLLWSDPLRVLAALFSPDGRRPAVMSLRVASMPAFISRFAAFCVLLVLTGLPLLAMAVDAAAATEDTTARYQVTYIGQRKGAFRSPYAADNSLRADTERSYSLTAGAFFGVRPWRDGELYFDPEMTLGLPLSDLAGLGGFTNGEMTRVSGRGPTIYRQRLYLRQTWNQGGGSQAVEPDLNQMAGSVDTNRFVLTAGNFSLLDVFDDNSYAHDPRVDFLNWSQMSYTAYDYAADARGYGWGVAGEWYRGDWVLRFARMTVPREPNQLRLSYQVFRHYGDQFEVEHAHELAGRPGKLRVLAWRNRGVLSKFRDAIDFARANGTTPDINAVRTSIRTKYGLGVNAEQAVSDNAGVFLRAMWADGATETQSFTEADRSLSGGLSINGAAWARDRDTVGVSLARNGLSNDRQQYLAAGGLSFFIGDGALRYRPETILEAYYSLGLAKNLWLTADVQRIANPAYNADRGPANFFALRLHAEF
jgi:high affinity Mn2+ porin